MTIPSEKTKLPICCYCGEIISSAPKRICPNVWKCEHCNSSVTAKQVRNYKEVQDQAYFQARAQERRDSDT